MRKIIFILFFLSYSIGLLSQDIIILKTGDEIECLVKEVGIDIIKYVKFSNQSGPVYLKKKREILLRSTSFEV